MAMVEEVVRRLIDTGKLKVNDDDVQTEEENPINCGECHKRLVDAESNQKEVNIAIFQLLQTLEEKMEALSLKNNEDAKKVNDVKTEMMNGVNNIKMEVIYQVKKMKTEADKSGQDVKNKLRQHKTQMNSVRKKGDFLFRKTHNLNAETKEGLKDIQDMKFRDCNRAPEAVSTLFQSTLNEKIQKEVTSMAEKHREEMTQLTQKMEQLSEELKQCQLSLRNELEDGLKRLEIRNQDYKDLVMDNSINILERNIYECDLLEELTDIEPSDFQLENPHNPQVFDLSMSNDLYFKVNDYGRRNSDGRDEFNNVKRSKYCHRYK